MSRRRMLG